MDSSAMTSLFVADVPEEKQAHASIKDTVALDLSLVSVPKNPGKYSSAVIPTVNDITKEDLIQMLISSSF